MAAVLGSRPAASVGVLATYGISTLGVWDFLYSLVRRDPAAVIREQKEEIIATSIIEGVPPELVAAVMLSELNAFGGEDFLGDYEMFTGSEERSIGIAQLQINDVRDWNLLLPEWGAANASAVPAPRIRAALIDPDDSTRLLAQAVKYFAKQGPKTEPIPGVDPPLGHVGTSFSFAGWAARPEPQRAHLGEYFVGAKDDIRGYLNHGTQSVDFRNKRIYQQAVILLK